MAQDDKILKVRLNPALQQMLADLVAKRGYDNQSEAVKAAIRLLHKKEVPAYTMTKDEQDLVDEMTNEEYAEQVGGKIFEDNGVMKVLVMDGAMERILLLDNIKDYKPHASE